MSRFCTYCRSKFHVMWSIVMLTAIAAVPALSEETPSIPTYEQLAAKAEFRQAEISPDGKYLAVDVGP